MFENDSLAVVRASMPYVDRRSLSEAWFSALHLVNATPRAVAGRSGAPEGNLATAVPHTSRRAASVPLGASPASRFRPVQTFRNEAAASESSRRGSERASATRTASTVAERSRSYPARQTSLTLGVDGGRVQLVLRREGNVLHVVALCRPEAAPVVRRALACADAHLRAGGDVLRSSVNDEETSMVRA